MNQFLKTVFQFGIIFFASFYHNSINAQADCASHLSSNLVSYINETQVDRSTIQVSQFITNTIEIPIVAHVIETDTDDSNALEALNEEELNLAISKLNSGYLSAGFNFTLCETKYHQGFNKVYYSPHPKTGNEYLLAAQTSEKRALNIYFVPEAFDLNGKGVCGWASFPGEYHKNGKNWIVIKNECVANESTLIHEVGHFFNLYHTHQTVNRSLGITEEELADGSNWGPNAGDGVRDTPAEPYRGGNGINGIVNEECLILCEYKDLKDNTYNIANGETNYNYMSYAPYECRNHFTDDQIERMKVSYLIDRSYLSETCPGVTEQNNNTCNSAKETKALFRLNTLMNAPNPVYNNGEMNWPGVTYTDGCVSSVNWSNIGLTGNIPYEIEDLKQLTSLILSNNDICGTIPANMVNLTKLQVLDLSGNQISGSIPEEFASMEDLMTINLSDNDLCGYVPYQLSTLSNLNDLSLSGNDFSGCIHPSLQNLCGYLPNNICSNCNRDDWDAIKSIYDNTGGAKMISNSGNLFQNPNPPFNCDLSNASFVRLNEYGRVKGLWFFNYGLTGSLPNDIEKLADLKDLEMNYNNLSGYLPSSLGNLTKLTSAHFAYNNLNGALPVNLTKLCDQAIVGLSDNPDITGNLYLDFCNGKRGYIENVDNYVMPGDFNNDKKVNNADLLYWSEAYGESGPQRLDAHIAWLPQYCTNWNGSSEGINHKHQDANGDGIINENDLEAFRLNFGKGVEIDAFDQSGSSTPSHYLNLVGDGSNGFYVSLKAIGENTENITSLIFTLDFGNMDINGLSFDYADINDEKQPIAEEINFVDRTNHVTIALAWPEDNPPPTEDPFGRLIIAVVDNGTDGNESLRIGNVQILSNGDFISLDGSDIDVFDTSNEAGACIDQYVSNDLNISKDYFAPDYIVSPKEEDQQAYVNGCTTVTFNSGGYVLLNPGFKNQHGTVFCAQIGGESWEEACDNPKYNPFMQHQHSIDVYPNPAKNQATIAFNLAEAGTVSLNITDMTGKHITTLLDGTTKEKGKHTVQYNTNELPTGVYYCTLKDNETLSTQKLIVVQ